MSSGVISKFAMPNEPPISGYAVIAMVALIIVPLLFITRTAPIDPNLLIVGAIVGLALIAIQAAVIVAAGQARNRRRAQPTWLGVAGVVIECSLPTAALFAHIELATSTPFVVLTTPPLLGYALLISLNLLRLQPSLCILGGVVASFGYVAQAPMDGRPPATSCPLLLFVCGVASAWVSHKIRAHLEAALHEAELKRQMDRIEHDMLIASTIPRSLLPHSAPAVPGFDIAGWNRPADQTGGDYYDWQRLPDGRWIVTLADVSGNGPALVTAACLAYVRVASHHYNDLAHLATRVNAMLAEDLPAGRFVTMASVLIDPADASLALLSAATARSCCLSAPPARSATSCRRTSPLAISPEESFGPAIAFRFTPGDTLVLVTDGVIE